MYLSKLELHGFKSFADRTVLQFDPGITAIVGPNGCGKSNIVDAVRWVIGEQRARILRSEKMENVIFNGTAKRKPIGMGEVLLTIENNRGVLPTEYAEVELGRRLYRSGDSDYLMNGVQCRLKDVTDLFMDTGMGAGAYSVIELKMIDEILSDDADDRRRLFEEAAGITKYKLRRRQTLSKLDSTQTDLDRIRDLAEEIGKQVRSLQRQAGKAEKYKAYSERLHHLELALAQVEYIRLMEQRNLLTAEITSLREESAKTGSSETRDESALEQLRIELNKRETELTENRTAYNQHLEIVRNLETEQKLAEERLESAGREQERAQAEQEDAAGRRGDLEAQLAEIQTAIERSDPELTAALRLLGAAQKERDARRVDADTCRKTLQGLRNEERLLENRRAEQRRRLDRLMNRSELLDEEAARAREQIEATEASLEELRSRVAKTDEQRAQAEAAITNARASFEAASEARASLQQEVHDNTDLVRDIERRRDALTAEVQLLESLLSSYDEFSGAVQFLASSDWAPDGLNTVSDVLACDEEDRVAIDAALGPYATCVVVKTEADAHTAIDVLRREAQGRATFIVLDRLRRLSAASRIDTEADHLLDRVRTSDPEYRKLADVLLRNSYVVDTLEEAVTLASDAAHTSRFFARTGEWIDAKGVVHGGSRQEGASPASGRLGRREQLASAATELAEIEDRFTDAENHLNSKKAAFDAVPFARLAEEVRSAERRLNEAEKAEAAVSFELRSSESRRTELDRRNAEAEMSRASIGEEISELEVALTDASAGLQAVQSRIDEADAASEKVEEEYRAAAARFNEANIAAVEIRNRCENQHRDLERTRQRIDELQARFEQRKTRILELEQIINSATERLSDVKKATEAISGKRRDLHQAVAYAEEAVHQTRDAIGNVEGALRGIRNRREQLMKEKHRRDVRIAEIQTRAADLVDHIQQEFGVSLPDATAGSATIPEGLDEKEARLEVADLRRSIRALGAVNELALESYEEEKERLEFLTKQQEDLEKAEETLLETIKEINTTASERFMETFELIRTNFQRIFNSLFGSNAGADLVLEDSNDPLETAIDIKARPRGKRPCGIAQLSGGEKTLTAIALLFGIYLVKPSPFCILDEVDAPLDDSNVERFMGLIREFAADIQFILVTHNKRTMEAADRLYGITMQETGVSRLVGVKFDEAVEIVDHASREAA